jgi:hypothetical protein
MKLESETKCEFVIGNPRNLWELISLGLSGSADRQSAISPLCRWTCVDGHTACHSLRTARSAVLKL